MIWQLHPHAPYGPIALAATLQVDVCSPNVFIQEQSLGIHYNKGFDLLDFVKNKDVFQYENGFVKVPTLPGLGLEIDEEKVKGGIRPGTALDQPPSGGTTTEPWPVVIVGVI